MSVCLVYVKINGVVDAADVCSVGDAVSRLEVVHAFLTVKVILLFTPTLEFLIVVNILSIFKFTVCLRVVSLDNECAVSDLLLEYLEAVVFVATLGYAVLDRPPEDCVHCSAVYLRVKIRKIFLKVREISILV